MAMPIADLSLAEAALVGGVAFAASVLGGLAGYGTGLVLPVVLAPVLGVAPVVPVMALAMMINNASRVAAFRHDVQWPHVRRILWLALPLNIAAAWFYTRLEARAIAALLGLFLLASLPLRAWLRRRSTSTSRSVRPAGHAGTASLPSGACCAAASTASAVRRCMRRSRTAAASSSRAASAVNAARCARSARSAPLVGRGQHGRFVGHVFAHVAAVVAAAVGTLVRGRGDARHRAEQRRGAEDALGLPGVEAHAVALVRAQRARQVPQPRGHAHAADVVQQPGAAQRGAARVRQAHLRACGSGERGQALADEGHGHLGPAEVDLGHHMAQADVVAGTVAIGFLHGEGGVADVAQQRRRSSAARLRGRCRGAASAPARRRARCRWRSSRSAGAAGRTGPACRRARTRRRCPARPAAG
jgi:hypothetical protein